MGKTTLPHGDPSILFVVEQKVTMKTQGYQTQKGEWQSQPSVYKKDQGFAIHDSLREANWTNFMLLPFFFASMPPAFEGQQTPHVDSDFIIGVLGRSCISLGRLARRPRHGHGTLHF